jgi:hypothetical protein
MKTTPSPAPRLAGLPEKRLFSRGLFSRGLFSKVSSSDVGDIVRVLIRVRDTGWDCDSL